MSPEETIRLDEFLARAELLTANDGGQINQLAWGTEIAIGFKGLPKGSVEPGFTVRILDGAFSTYTVIAFDPNGR
jgi:hypothetical protein